MKKGGIFAVVAVAILAGCSGENGESVVYKDADELADTIYTRSPKTKILNVYGKDRLFRAYTWEPADVIDQLVPIEVPKGQAKVTIETITNRGSAMSRIEIKKDSVYNFYTL